jgi:sortase A
MRLVVPKQTLRWILRWTQRALFAAAVAILAYCGFVLLDAWAFQKRERAQLERLLHDRRETNDGARQAAFSASSKNPPPAVTGGLIGRIEIPRLGLSAMIVEGATKTILQRAAGHISGTALPGQPGNVCIAGHRDTFFRPLRNIRRNDIITLTTLLGKYRYRVVSTNVVGPYDVAVLDPSSKELLTLVTCYPFYFVGSAPGRFVVRAEKVANAS